METSKIICVYCCKFIPRNLHELHFQRHRYLKKKLESIEEEKLENMEIARKFFQECHETFKNYF